MMVPFSTLFVSQLSLPRLMITGAIEDLVVLCEESGIGVADAARIQRPDRDTRLEQSV